MSFQSKFCSPVLRSTNLAEIGDINLVFQLVFCNSFQKFVFSSERTHIWIFRIRKYIFIVNQFFPPSSNHCKCGVSKGQIHACIYVIHDLSTSLQIKMQQANLNKDLLTIQTQLHAGGDTPTRWRRHTYTLQTTYLHTTVDTPTNHRGQTYTLQATHLHTTDNIPTHYRRHTNTPQATHKHTTGDTPTHHRRHKNTPQATHQHTTVVRRHTFTLQATH